MILYPPDPWPTGFGWSSRRPAGGALRPFPYGASPSRRYPTHMARPRSAFSLLELLIVIAVIALLAAILSPSFAAARTQAKATVCASRLQQLGVALSLYFNDFDNTLPQARGPLQDGTQGVIGVLFGGKAGRLPLNGINEVGVEGRPLNAYVATAASATGGPEQAGLELEPFRSPCDKGAQTTNLFVPGFEQAESYYDLVGSSYALNDHSLDGDGFPTLIPPGGGRMPWVLDPTKTWVLAAYPIYTYQQDSDRGCRWYSDRAVESNMLFLDMHTRVRVPIPNILCQVENTTDDYTFFPVPPPLLH